MSIGKRLLRSLLAESTWDYSKYGVSLTDFGEAFEAACFVENFRSEHGILPTEEQVLENCPLDFTKPPEPVKYVADIILRQKANFELEEGLKRAAKYLRDADLEDAIKLIKEMADKEYFPVESENSQKFIEDGEIRFQEYLDNKNKDFSGIPWPWPTLTAATHGMLPAELSVFIAPPAGSKSWSAIVVASECLRAGKTVLLVTMEMPAKAFAARLDCAYYKIPFRDIRQNDLDYFTEKRWKNSIEYPETSGEIHLYDYNTVTYVTDLSDLVGKVKPDLVIVDGGYLVKSIHGKGGSWEDTSKAILELQEACKKSNLPWMVTTQQNLPEKKTMTSNERANKVRYGKEWFITANNMVELSQTQEQRDFTKDITMRLLKCREFDNREVRMEWNCIWDNEFAKFDEIPPDQEIEFQVDVF
jgi:DnaB-like helicase C terminal domain